MNTLLIGYDLNRPGQQYAQLFEHIKEISSTWWHYLDSTWIVRTNLSASQARDALARLTIDPNDELLVVDVTGDAAAWRGFNQQAGRWLQDNL